MRLPRFRFTVRRMMVAVASIALVATLASAGWRWTADRVVVENRSDVAIVSLSVAVAGRSIDFAPIPPGSKAEATYRIDGDDSSFELVGKLSDGTTFGGNFGYVTGSMYGDVARFVIGPGGEVDFHQGP